MTSRLARVMFVNRRKLLLEADAHFVFHVNPEVRDTSIPRPFIETDGLRLAVAGFQTNGRVTVLAREPLQLVQDSFRIAAPPAIGDNEHPLDLRHIGFERTKRAARDGVTSGTSDHERA